MRKSEIEKQIEKFQEFTANYRFLLTGLLFVIPIFPDTIICLGAVVIHIEYNRFLLIAMCSKCISIGLIAFSSTLGMYFDINKYSIVFTEIVIITLISVIMKKTNKGVN